MYDYKANPMTYQVKMRIRAPMRADVNRDMTMSQEDLDKTIGRWTRRHGPPINMSEGGKSITSLNFYNKVDNGVWEIDITYEQTAASSPLKQEEKTIATPSAPPKVEEPEHEQIKALREAGVITRAYSHNYRY